MTGEFPNLINTTKPDPKLQTNPKDKKEKENYTKIHHNQIPYSSNKEEILKAAWEKAILHKREQIQCKPEDMEQHL